MIEVKLWLYSPEETYMFAQFSEILVNRRNAIAKLENAKMTGVAPDQIGMELEKESEQAPVAFSAPAAVQTALSNAAAVDAAATPSPDTVAQAIEKFKAYAQTNGLPKARAVLDQLGLKRAGDVTAAQIPALLEAIK